MAARFSEEEVLKATSALRLQSASPQHFEDVCTDTRSLKGGCLFVALVGERFDAHAFLAEAKRKGAAGALVQKGQAFDTPDGLLLYEVKDTLAALGLLAQAHRRRFGIPLGAVTGSNGKTTTKEMVASILGVTGPALATQGNLNNEVGVPLTLFGLEASHRAAVIEMGMNHAGEIARLTAWAEPTAGLITCVQAAHLKGLGSLDGVALAKGELFEGLSPDAVAVVNLDDPLVLAQASRARAKKMTFGRGRMADVRLEQAHSQGDAGLSLRINSDGKSWEVAIGLVGAHNALNATGAFALARALGSTPEQCVMGLNAAKPYARRLNVLQAPGGITVLDDCYNANPASMVAALETLEGLSQKRRAVVVVGDMLELGEGEVPAHRALGEKVGRVAQLAAFFGPLSQEGCRASGLKEQAAHFTEVEPLVLWLRDRLKSNDVVLVKGSRGMKLERVVQALTQAASVGGGGH